MMKRFSDLLGADPYPGETPQAESNREQLKRDYTTAPESDPEEYNWAMTPTHVSVSGDHHADLFGAMQHHDLDNKPHAYGTLTLCYNWEAVFTVDASNMSLHLVEKKLKRYCSDQGWQYKGIIDDSGMPLESPILKQGSVPGIGEINPGVKDWRINEWSGTGQYDNPGTPQSETPFYGFDDQDQLGSAE